METTKEKIKVMQAFENGHAIEINFKGMDIWEDCPYPQWDWNLCDYRVKAEETIRPFKSVKELVDWWGEHYAPKNRPPYTMPLIWVRNKSSEAIFLIDYFNPESKEVGSRGSNLSLDDLFRCCTFLDGKPCGVEGK